MDMFIFWTLFAFMAFLSFPILLGIAILGVSITIWCVIATFLTGLWLLSLVYNLCDTCLRSRP
jgi:hypothetical protein